MCVGENGSEKFSKDGWVRCLVVFIVGKRIGSVENLFGDDQMVEDGCLDSYFGIRIAELSDVLYGQQKVEVEGEVAVELVVWLKLMIFDLKEIRFI